MTLFFYIILALFFYLLGSIPNALIVGSFFGKTDVRKHGSGNLGATNTLRVLGKKAGYLTFVLDFSKCYFPIVLANYLASIGVLSGVNPYYVSIFLALGHCYPIFANFKGGKAVSSTVGILCAINPLISLITITIFFSVTYITKYVSVGSTFLVTSGLVSAILLKETNPEILTVILLMLLITFKHIPNYKKLINKTENKAFVKKK